MVKSIHYQKKFERHCYLFNSLLPNVHVIYLLPPPQRAFPYYYISSYSAFGDFKYR